MHCIATRNSNDVPSRIALTDVRINDAWIIIEYDDAVVCSWLFLFYSFVYVFISVDVRAATKFANLQGDLAHHNFCSQTMLDKTLKCNVQNAAAAMKNAHDTQLK